MLIRGLYLLSNKADERLVTDLTFYEFNRSKFQGDFESGFRGSLALSYEQSGAREPSYESPGEHDQ